MSVEQVAGQWSQVTHSDVQSGQRGHGEHRFQKGVAGRQRVGIVQKQPPELRQRLEGTRVDVVQVVVVPNI